MATDEQGPRDASATSGQAGADEGLESALVSSDALAEDHADDTEDMNAPGPEIAGISKTAIAHSESDDGMVVEEKMSEEEDEASLARADEPLNPLQEEATGNAVEDLVPRPGAAAVAAQAETQLSPLSEMPLPSSARTPQSPRAQETAPSTAESSEPAPTSQELAQERAGRAGSATAAINAHATYESLTLLGSLVPSRVIRYHLEQKGETRLTAFSEEFEGAVLFADISGFSSLAEKLAKDLNCAANAAENLSSYIGKSLEKMVHEVCVHGGDVIKFAGDAILTVFPASKFRDLDDATLCCTQVALQLLKLDLRAGGVQLSVHCGVGAGKVVSYHVGGRNNRWEYVITGDPIEQIGSAEPEAEAGEVVIAKAAYERIASGLVGVTLPSGNFRVDNLKAALTPRIHPFVTAELEPLLEDCGELSRMQDCLRSYVPRPVLQAIDAGQSLWFSELRLCSTLFCRLKGLHFHSASNLDLIHKAVCTVQKHVYAYEGTLCRFIVDDKGAGLLLAFGLPPFMHENDPVRATKSAMDICAAISDLVNDDGEPLSASIGVTSGRVFCGTTGGRIRCEYTLHGTLVNLAARYMVAAKTGVLCGETTHREACEHVEFGEPEKLKVKGKDEEVLVYRPLGAKTQQGFEVAKTPLLGRKKETDAIYQALRRLSVQSGLSEVIMLSGEAGIGKSRLMQEAYAGAQRQKCSVVVGKGQDTESATAFYIFRSILSQLVNHYFTKVVWYRFEVWLQIARQDAMEGVASTFAQNFSKVLFTKYLSKSFFQRLGEACRPAQAEDESKEQGSKNSGSNASPSSQSTDSKNHGETRRGGLSTGSYGSGASAGEDKGADASADFLKYMGLMENPVTIETSATPQLATHWKTPPPLESLPDHIRLHVVRDMIPVGKDNLEEMYPLLSIFIPKIVQSSDTETTAKMRKEVRAENRIRLIKEIVNRCAAELEALRSLVELVERQLERQNKALSRLGVNVEETTHHPPAESGQMRGASGSKTDRELTFGRKRRGRSVQSSSGGEDDTSSASLGIVQEDIANHAAKAKSPNLAGSRQTTGSMSHRNSYMMRMGGSRVMAQQSRLVLMIEDIQFVDPLSLRLLQEIAMETRPLLVLLTVRSLERIRDNLILDEYEHIEVGCLSREEVREGMCKWLGVRDVPDKALSAVMEKSMGHPLFSEELSKLMVAEGMIIIEGDTARLSKKAQEGNFGLPDTVSALMTSKLDRLKPSEQLVLKVAAVIGTEFQRNELDALMPRMGNNERLESSSHLGEDHDVISDDLSALVEKGLVVRDAQMMYHYRFTSAMLRESAYNLLLYQNRKDFHKKLADFQEARNKEYLDPVYFLLATNYFLAEEYEKAMHYSELAGKIALETHAMQQVLVCFSRLIEMDRRGLEVTQSISLAHKIGWKRKVGEALLLLGKPVDAEEYFFAALEDANLHSVAAAAKQDASCLGLGSVGRNTKLHLVKNTSAFQEMVQSKNAQLLLEASATYESLSKINHDRMLSCSLEYRLNALDLAKAAESFLRETEGQGDLLESATARLARTCAYVAVFYVSIGAPGMLDLARDHMHTAIQLVDTSDRVKDSGTQALVRFKSAKFSSMVGEMKQASDRVRKALWICNFLNMERLLLEAQTLSLTIQLLMGQVSKAKATLKTTVAKMSQAAPNYVILALSARTACLVGDFSFAELCLERIGRMPAGHFATNHVSATRDLMKSSDPEVHIGLALLLSRKYGTQNLAVSAAMRGIEALQSEDLSDLNITKFHTAAFLLTALAEGLSGTPLLKTRKRRLQNKADADSRQRMSLSQIIPFEDLEITQSVRHIRKQAGKHLKNILALLSKYAKVYALCRPHTKYCLGLYQKILRGHSRSKTLKTFLQAAQEAQEAETLYVKGLALLEAGIIDKQYLDGARESFLACANVKAGSDVANGSKKLDPTQIKDAPYELQLMNEDVLAE